MGNRVWQALKRIFPPTKLKRGSFLRQNWKEDLSSDKTEKRIFPQTKLKRGFFLRQNWKEDFSSDKTEILMDHSEKGLQKWDGRCLKGYSKTCLKRRLKRRPKIGFQDQLLLNAGQKYCRMLQESILQYFRPSISYHLSLRPLFCLFLSGRLRQVLLYWGTTQRWVTVQMRWQVIKRIFP